MRIVVHFRLIPCIIFDSWPDITEQNECEKKHCIETLSNNEYDIFPEVANEKYRHIHFPLRKQKTKNKTNKKDRM